MVFFFMIDQRHITIHTLWHPVAGIAFDAEREPTTVLKEDYLFLVLYGQFNVIDQKG
jgi:hypothetical protein